MADSIRKCLDQNDTIEELKLLLSDSKDKVFVVVEGDEDVRLFMSLLREEACLVQSFKGKLGVEEMIKVHFPRKKQIIGIRDKDYQKKPLNNRIFYCDYCCSEMMVVANDECFIRVSNSICKEVSKAKTLRLMCLQCLELLSEIRYLNERKKWGIKFEGLRLTKLYDPNQSIMDYNIIQNLNKMNPKNLLSAKRLALLKRFFPFKHNEEELLDITNGHDFMNIFHCIGKVGMKISETGKVFKISFGKNEFKQTKLYKDLLKFQQKMGLLIVDF